MPIIPRMCSGNVRDRMTATGDKLTPRGSEMYVNLPVGGSALSPTKVIYIGVGNRGSSVAIRTDTAVRD